MKSVGLVLVLSLALPLGAQESAVLPPPGASSWYLYAYRIADALERAARRHVGAVVETSPLYLPATLGLTPSERAVALSATLTAKPADWLTLADLLPRQREAAAATVAGEVKQKVLEYYDLLVATVAECASQRALRDLLQAVSPAWSDVGPGDFVDIRTRADVARARVRELAFALADSRRSHVRALVDAGLLDAESADATLDSLRFAWGGDLKTDMPRGMLEGAQDYLAALKAREAAANRQVAQTTKALADLRWLPKATLSTTVTWGSTGLVGTPGLAGTLESQLGGWTLTGKAVANPSAPPTLSLSLQYTGREQMPAVSVSKAAPPRAPQAPTLPERLAAATRAYLIADGELNLLRPDGQWSSDERDWEPAARDLIARNDAVREIFTVNGRRVLGAPGLGGIEVPQGEAP